MKLSIETLSVLAGLSLLLPGSGAAFVATAMGKGLSRGNSSTQRSDMVGGWGIGPQRDLKPEEFANRGERRHFEGYQLRDRGEFMRQVKADKDNLLQGEMDELLGVAASAGIQVKDPAERRNQFMLDDEYGDDAVLGEELDVSVQWDQDEKTERVGLERTERTRSTGGESITRLDEDTGASGVW